MTRFRPNPSPPSATATRTHSALMLSSGGVGNGRGATNGSWSAAQIKAATSLHSSDDDMLLAAFGTYTKGLSHDPYGRVRAGDLKQLITALTTRHAGFNVPLYSGGFLRPSGSHEARRQESPLATPTPLSRPGDGELGATGPTAAPQMPASPELGSDELTAEMGELYAAALLRDIPFERWPTCRITVRLTEQLADLAYFQHAKGPAAAKRRLARGDLDPAHLFNGCTPGDRVGPYISQFLLVGNREHAALDALDTEDGPKAARAAPSQDALSRAARYVPAPIRKLLSTQEDCIQPNDGVIRYGVQMISQRFAGHLDGCDHMTEWATWLDVQNGSNRKDAYDRFRDTARFITTPRDLATYVHFDTLFQAYQNAALILLGAEEPTDQGLPEGRGHPTRDGAATFGAAHILSMLAEVGHLALTSAQSQKFAPPLTARPEALAAGIALSQTGGSAAESLGSEQPLFARMSRDLTDSGLLSAICQLNRTNNRFWSAQYGAVDLGPLHEDSNALLPQVYPEGSPMHPGHGSAHATVAGACVTVLKAFFEMYQLPAGTPERGRPILTGAEPLHPAAYFSDERMLSGEGAMLPHPYTPDPEYDYTRLAAAKDSADLTVQGELNKLASNISFGRCFAGVQRYSEHYESLRQGERIAVDFLRRKLMDGQSAASVRFASFDGDHVAITCQPPTVGSRATAKTRVHVWDRHGKGGTEAAYDAWRDRHR
ncbi:MAG: hypothetical protein VX083_18480 [Pseudomonadota bacterium]|nr:hypothetical protein [Pseudomonadota bacterium]MEC8295482.1 hypothetical protein [Pseudomonadota bacterium]